MPDKKTENEVSNIAEKEGNIEFKNNNFMEELSASEYSNVEKSILNDKIEFEKVPKTTDLSVDNSKSSDSVIFNQYNKMENQENDNFSYSFEEEKDIEITKNKEKLSFGKRRNMEEQDFLSMMLDFNEDKIYTQNLRSADEDSSSSIVILKGPDLKRESVRYSQLFKKRSKDLYSSNLWLPITGAFGFFSALVWYFSGFC